MDTSKHSLLAGINSETLRYYENNNLLIPVGKTEAGYRLYSDDSLKQINFIKQAKAFGFSLKEIKELLSLRINNSKNRKQAREKAQEKLIEVRAKIKNLKLLEGTLKNLIDDCKNNKASKCCPIIEKMDS
ncbi:MAG: MerR family DNA-binding protein [Bdellovibrionales bacterium]|nr:MerR family DNA-binding protein [Bdellovibrionales bacterium]